MEQKRRAGKGKVPDSKRGKLTEKKLALNPAFLNEEIKREFTSCWRYTACARVSAALLLVCSADTCARDLRALSALPGLPPPTPAGRGGAMRMVRRDLAGNM